MPELYHRYLQHENGRFQKQRVPPPAPKPQAKPQAKPPETTGLPFLKKLLPNMDTGDLLVIVLLLLLLAEGNEDSDSIVMTLAIFLFLQ